MKTNRGTNKNTTQITAKRKDIQWYEHKSATR